MIKFNFNITLSKVFAFLILGLCFWYGFVNKDSGIITLGVTVSAGLVGFRQGMQTIKEVKNNNK